LVPSYNLEFENYKEKHSLLTLDLNSNTKLEDRKVLDTYFT